MTLLALALALSLALSLALALALGPEARVRRVQACRSGRVPAGGTGRE